MDKKKLGKLATPLVITGSMIIFLIYNIMQAASFPGLIRAQPLLVILPVFMIAINVIVLVQRIREINSGEEDDLDKY